VNHLAEILFGPLFLPECTRALSRSWIVVVRCLAAIAASAVALSVIWWWWFSLQVDPSYMPYAALRIGLSAIEIMAVVLALLIAPAVLAGSLAGEKERGTLGLLLTTRVNSWEIVTGRLTGKLVQAGIVLLAGIPLWVLLAALAGLRVPTLLGMIGLPTVLAIGSGSVALAASAVARRGRDALLAVYLAGFLLIPLITTAAANISPGAAALAAPINPFHGVNALVWAEDPEPAAWSMLIWAILGSLALGVAAWRLRPSALRLLSGDVRFRRRRRRRWFVPPVDEDRPMLWKELFIERISPLGRVGTWLGVIAVALLIGISTAYAGLLVHRTWNPQTSAVDWYTDWIGSLIADSAATVGVLIQLSIVLRAAVAISSERERRTWDALLISPMEGREIVIGKLCGSLYALRWLILAGLWAWTLALLCSAMTLKDFLFQLLGIVVIGACMSAIGVRTSLATATSTKSMTLAVGLWMAAVALLSLLAAMLLFTLFLAIQLAWWSYYGFMSPSGVPPPLAWLAISFGDSWRAVQLLLYLALTLAVVIESRYRFDRIAGRMTGGEVEVAVDQFLHGVPMAPVPLNAWAAGKSAITSTDPLPPDTFRSSP
jgi:ABC-type transport system involved in multi-copper enzyme maturation permease subunit